MRRRYRDETLVLESEFETEDGTARVVDCMPRQDDLDVVQVVEGVGGRVPMRRGAGSTSLPSGRE